MPRRSVMLAAAALLSGVGRARADDAPWPARRVRIVIPFAAGAAQDIFTRIIADRLSRRLGTTIYVDNKPGAGGAVGALETARAAPDGATLLSTSNSVVIVPVLQPQLGLDPQRQLAPIALICDVAGGLMVRRESPFTDLPDLIAKARAAPGRYTFGSGGVGSANHMSGALFASMAGLEVTHVPYRGIAQALVGVYAGDIDFAFGSMLSLAADARDGRARLLGVTSPERLPALPAVPAIGEHVSGYASRDWFALFAPRGLPQPLTDRLTSELAALRDDPELPRDLAAGLAIMRLDGPEPLATRMADDIAKWRDLAMRANIHVE
jgi:tripartite-type tricarboxylate transporter receptor subunit TctC